jgi:hypothetical protein
MRKLLDQERTEDTVHAYSKLMVGYIYFRCSEVEMENILIHTAGRDVMCGENQERTGSMKLDSQANHLLK